jgi:putative transposase
MLRRHWPRWKSAPIIVSPETVVHWYRAGFKLYWTWLSRHRKRAGKKCLNKELRELIFRMVAESPRWGAPRIHGSLKMLGFDIPERTVLCWMRKAPRNPEPAKRWAAFLANHREIIAAMDFFTIPTVTFGVLYCFLVIAHDSRRILHFNVTRNPSGALVSQQMSEALPYDSAPRYLIFDRDANFSTEVVETANALGVKPFRTSIRSPWQNGIAEHFVGSCRREFLDQVIPTNVMPNDSWQSMFATTTMTGRILAWKSKLRRVGKLMITQVLTVSCCLATTRRFASSLRPCGLIRSGG